jgi:hypothetical protein
MSKKTLLLVISLTIFSFAKSQEITVGVKGGINFYTVGDLLSYGGSYQTGAPDIVFTPDQEMGTQYGMFLDVSFGRIFLRPEIIFSSLKSSYALPLKVANYTSTRMDIPVLLGFHIAGPVSIVAGPVFSSVSDLELEGLEPDKPSVIYDESLLNFQAGILLEMGRFGVDIRYEYGLKKVESQDDLDFFYQTPPAYGINRGALLEYNASQIIVSVHINIARFNSNERKSMSRSDWRNHKRL